MSLAGATSGEPGDTQAKPGQKQDFHKDCGGSKMAATCQLPSHQFPLPLSTPREPPTPTGWIRGAGKRAHSDLSPETPSLIAYSFRKSPSNSPRPWFLTMEVQLQIKYTRRDRGDRPGPLRPSLPRGCNQAHPVAAFR